MFGPKRPKDSLLKLEKGELNLLLIKFRDRHEYSLPIIQPKHNTILLKFIIIKNPIQKEKKKRKEKKKHNTKIQNLKFVALCLIIIIIIIIKVIG